MSKTISEYPDREAQVLSSYLGGKTCSAELVKKYNAGIRELALHLNSKETGVLKKLLKYPFLLPLTDAGLALLSPASVIRKRLLLMAALIETDTQYTHLFITETNTSFPVLHFLYRGTNAVLKTVTGSILILILGWK